MYPKVPGKIIEINARLDENFRTATILSGGVHIVANLCMLPYAKIGDHVLVHDGVAIDIVNELEAQSVLEYLNEVAKADELETADYSCSVFFEELLVD